LASSDHPGVGAVSAPTPLEEVMSRPHRPVPDTDKLPPGTSPPPFDHEPVERPGPDPDTDGDPLDT
jgi:hypothetical protein